MPRPLTTFAARLRWWMDRYDLSQSELARQSGVAQTTISDLLAARCEPSLVTADRLAIAMQIKVDALNSPTPWEPDE